MAKIEIVIDDPVDPNVLDKIEDWVIYIAEQAGLTAVVTVYPKGNGHEQAS